MPPLLLAAAAEAASCTPMRLNDLGHLLQVMGTFLGLSLFSLGGGNTVLAEYHHLSAVQYCCLRPSQFADLYALAEAAPGQPLGTRCHQSGLGKPAPDEDRVGLRRTVEGFRCLATHVDV